VFQVMFVLQNTPRGGLTLPGLSLTPEVLPQRVEKFDLTLSVQETAEEIRGNLKYASDLFDQDTLERWAQYLKSLLEEMTDECGTEDLEPGAAGCWRTAAGLGEVQHHGGDLSAGEIAP
jgi:non-ribosomal peptide synthetase component F